MYAAFYGLSSEPFRLSPSSRAGFAHPSYQRAGSYLRFALAQGEGVFVLTGEPGTGKSSLLTECIEDAGVPLDVAELTTGRLEADDVLRLAAIRFDIPVENVPKGLVLARLEARLRALGERGRRPLLVVDEAQDLSADALGEIRGLTNLRDGERQLLMVVLSGQPALLERIRSPDLAALHQRVIAACRLEPLAEEELKGYVEHCLRTSDWQGEPVLDDALFRRIHAASRGVPRRVNLIFGRLLLRGMVHDLHVLGTADLEAVLQDLRDEGLLDTADHDVGSGGEPIGS